MAAGESVRIDNDNPPASESDISDFLYCFSLPICENDRQVEIYLIEQWTNSAHPLPTKERSAATFDAQLDHNGGLYADYGIRPCHIVFRNRRDYLMEGVEDEIDAEELARWRRLQDIEDRMGVLQL